jgi:4-aminobutyrate aminotransferase/(S)-3-amino-2-methylpropionate transaminase
MAVAPPGTSQVFPMMCGTCSNENGIKLMFMRYMHKRRGGRTEFTEEELDTVLKHEAPGSPRLSILSFKGAFHGRTVGLLSCSNSRPIQGVDIPSLNWPKADFPVYKYPLEENVRENEAEDARCLARVEEILAQSSAEGQPVAGVISEPIQAEGGDNHGSPAFFRGLAEICKNHDISLMMDEVQTGGGATGKMWCHEHFGIEADVVSFSKKMVSGGVFHNMEHRPPHPGRILNTWVGDPHKIIILEQVVTDIQEEQLLDRVEAAGETIMSGLTELQNKFPALLSKARGRGTFCAVDLPDVAARDTLIKKLQSRGVHLGGCGSSSVRIRPSLTFTPAHANIMLDGINDVLGDMSNL